MRWPHVTLLGLRPRFAVAAISYAVAPAILAALTQPGGERMALIVGIGGYHDLTAAITYLTTGYYRPAPGAALALWHARPDRPLGVRPRRCLTTSPTRATASC